MEDGPSAGVVFGGISMVMLVGSIVLAAGMWGCPQYKVYEQRLHGEAALAEAESSKQIAVQVAKAKLESAKLLAESEVERAKGVAQANKIIGDSLNGHEDYLRYLWITGLENTGDKTIIYVPSEGGIPLLEAGRLGQERGQRQGAKQ